MGRLRSRSWRGVGGVGGDGIGFEGFQVRGLGSGWSKELGLEVGFGRLGSGLGKLGLGGYGRLRLGEWSQGLGWGRGVGELRSGGLGLAELVRIRGVEVKRVGVRRVGVGSKGFKLGRGGWGRKGWSWVRRGSNQRLGSRWSEELEGWGRSGWS